MTLLSGTRAPNHARHLLFYHHKIDFVGNPLISSNEVEQVLPVHILDDSCMIDTRASNSEGQFVLSISVGFPVRVELSLDEGSNTCTIERSSYDGGHNRNDVENSPYEKFTTWVDMRWKTATYCLCRQKSELLSIEICDKRSGTIIKRDIWKDLPIETKLSIADDVKDAECPGAFRQSFTPTIFLARSSGFYQLMHMVGNEQFVIIWSPVFLYIMAFDPAFRFGYEDVDFSRE